MHSRLADVARRVRASRRRAGPYSSDALYRKLFDNSTDGVLLTAPNGRIVMANAAATAMLGCTEEELCEGGLDAFVERDDPRLAAAVDERRRSGSVLTEVALTRKDGTRVEAELSWSAFRDREGLEWTSLTVRDISARKTNERLLNAIFEILPVGVWLADRTGRIVRVNEAAVRLWNGVEFVGTADFDVYRGWQPATGKRIAAGEWALARALLNGETTTREVVDIETFDGVRKTIFNSALPLYDNATQRVGAIAVAEDITELTRTQNALREAVDARDRVLEVVAHDLRHPLQMVATGVETLLIDSNGRPEDRGTLEDVREQVVRMRRMIGELLRGAHACSGPLAIERASIRADDLLNDASRAHRRAAAAAGVELRRLRSSKLGEVIGDRAQLARVFDNLITNALRFTPSGGVVTIGGMSKAEFTAFWVADTGVGIDEDAAAHMFDRGWSEDGAEGHGLGLSIAKAIVEAHGGRIRARARCGRGHGTTVFFTLPSTPR